MDEKYTPEEIRIYKEVTKPKPKGYWNAVFYEAIKLQRDRPNLKSDDAFWLARNMVEKEDYVTG